MREGKLEFLPLERERLCIKTACLIYIYIERERVCYCSIIFGAVSACDFHVTYASSKIIKYKKLRRNWNNHGVTNKKRSRISSKSCSPATSQ